jgi:hypothetical protein
VIGAGYRAQHSWASNHLEGTEIVRIRSDGDADGAIDNPFWDQDLQTAYAGRHAYALSSRWRHEVRFPLTVRHDVGPALSLFLGAGITYAIVSSTGRLESFRGYTTQTSNNALTGTSATVPLPTPIDSSNWSTTETVLSRTMSLGFRYTLGKRAVVDGITELDIDSFSLARANLSLVVFFRRDRPASDKVTKREAPSGGGGKGAAQENPLPEGPKGEATPSVPSQLPAPLSAPATNEAPAPNPTPGPAE